MFTHHRTIGFIIKKENRGESDRLFTIYTQGFGKMNFLARAERKVKSKLRSGLELFYLSEIEFIQGKVFKTLTDAIPLNKFSEIKKDLGKLEIALRTSRLLNRLVKGEAADEGIWNLLNDFFGMLQEWEKDRQKLKLLYFYFLWNFLSELGYRLELYKCIVCQKKLSPEKLFLNSREGGIVCQDCCSRIKGSKAVARDLIKILRIFLEKDKETLKRLKTGDLKELQEISRCYLLEVLEKIR